MIATQRQINALGGEMTAGLAFSQGLAAREIRRGLEPAFKDLQRQTIANLGAMKGWTASQLASIQGVGAFINKIGTLEYHLNEYSKHLEGVSRLSRYVFFGGTGGILALGGAASPQALRTLTASFGWLSAEIGTAFVPVIAKSAMLVQSMARAFHSLSPATKDFIGKWGTVAVVVAGVGVGVNVLVSAFAGLSTALRGVATAYAFVAASARTAAAAQATAAGVGGLSSLARPVAAGAAGAAAATGGGMAATFSLSSLAKGPGTAATAAGGLSVLSKVGRIGAVFGKITLWLTAVSEVISLFSDVADDLGKQFSLLTPIKTIARRAILGPITGGPIRQLLAWLTGSKALSDEGILGALPKGLKDFLTPGGNRLQLSPFGDIFMGSLEDAMRQVQLNMMRGLGPEGETLKIQQQQLLELQRIAVNTDGKGVGPTK